MNANRIDGTVIISSFFASVLFVWHEASMFSIMDRSVFTALISFALLWAVSTIYAKPKQVKQELVIEQQVKEVVETPQTKIEPEPLIYQEIIEQLDKICYPNDPDKAILDAIHEVIGNLPSSPEEISLLVETPKVKTAAKSRTTTRSTKVATTGEGTTKTKRTTTSKKQTATSKKKTATAKSTAKKTTKKTEA